MENALLSFFQQFPANEYPKNHLVLAAHTQSDFFYFVEKGAVKMTRTSRKGKNLILHIFFPDTFFSLFTLITSDVNQYDFITLTSTTIHKIPRCDLLTFLQTHNQVMFELQLRLLNGLKGLLKRIEQSSFTSAHDQVASLLLYFSKHFSLPATVNNSQTSKIRLSITHQEIADWLGLSRENVSLQMKQLERAGLIKMQDHLIEIIDSQELTKMSSLDSL